MPNNRRPRMALGAALLLSFTFGSVHAFGVLLRPLEQLLATSRLAASLGYSLALAAITAGVLAAPSVFARWSAAKIAFLCGVVGVAGLAISALATHVWQFIAGYGLLFGFSNGVAYALFLDQAGRACPDRQGLALGSATAAYGIGAAVFAPILARIAEVSGPASALFLIAAAVAVSSAAAGLAFAADVQGGNAPGSQGGGHSWPWRLWSIYGLAATGSLMVVAHADVLMVTAGAPPEVSHLAPSAFAIGNIAGSLAGGPWVDIRKVRMALATPILLSAASILVLAANLGPSINLVAVAGIGFAYGALIVAIPVVIRRREGADLFGPVFGRVFTAWGVAGLFGPLIGSALNSWFSGYGAALLLAEFAALSAFALLWRLVDQDRLSTTTPA